MSLVKLYAFVNNSVAVVTNGIDVPQDGVLQGISLGIVLTADATPADGDNIFAEVTFAGTPQFTSHDIRNSLATTAISLLRGTAEDTLVALPLNFATGIEVPVFAGERIFIHAQANQADMVGHAVSYLYIKDGLERSTIRRR